MSYVYNPFTKKLDSRKKSSLPLVSTERDINIYIDGTSGSDTTGLGTEAQPYATFDRAFEDVPYFIEHKVNIRAAAGTYTSFPRTVQHSINGDGQLVIEGLGDPVTYAGPFTATGVTDTSVDSFDITVAGSSWTVDDFAGKFLKYTNESDLKDRIVAIHRNNADTIKHTDTYYPDPAVGYTFEIVDPSVNVVISDVNTVFNIASNGVRRRANCIIANISFSNHTSNRAPFCFTNTGKYIMGCVKFSSSDLQSTLSMRGGGINDSTFSEEDYTQLVNPRLVSSDLVFGLYYLQWSSLIVENTKDDQLSYNNTTISLAGAENNNQNGAVAIGYFATRGKVYVVAHGGYLNNGICEYIVADHETRLSIYKTDIDGATNGIRIDDSSIVNLQDCVITAATGHAIQVEDACRVLIDGVDVITAGVTGYGVYIGRGSQVVAVGTNTLTGTTGYGYWTQTAAAFADPGKPGMATDTYGSTFIR